MKSNTLFALLLAASFTPCESAPLIGVGSLTETVNVKLPNVLLYDSTDCRKLLQDAFDYTKDGYHYLAATMTSNRSADGLAGWSVGKLKYQPFFFAPLPPFNIIPERLQGNVTTLLSNRVWYEPSVPCGENCFGITPKGHPFDPDQSALMGMDIRMDQSDATKALVILSPKSWSGPQIQVNAQCNDGHIYGLTNESGRNRQMIDISFVEATELTPPR